MPNLSNSRAFFEYFVDVFMDFLHALFTHLHLFESLRKLFPNTFPKIRIFCHVSRILFFSFPKVLNKSFFVDDNFCSQIRLHCHWQKLSYFFIPFLQTYLWTCYFAVHSHSIHPVSFGRHKKHAMWIYEFRFHVFRPLYQFTMNIQNTLL